MSNETAKKILFLAANSKDTSRLLRSAQEIREISTALRLAKNREQFYLETEWAVRFRDIKRAILDTNPQIVHFLGYDTCDQGLMFEDETGQPKKVSELDFARLLKLFSDQVECVVLNTSYSELQAQAISQHIRYVIAVHQQVSHEEAITFVINFYDALFAGESIESAYHFACTLMVGTDERIIYTLKKKPA